MASLVAENYSSALFELANEENKLDAVKNELNEINGVLNEYPDLYRILTHPLIEKSEKKDTLLKVFDGMDISVSSFVRLLIDKNRFNAFNDIVLEFNRKYNKANNIDVAYVTSAKELDETQINSLKAMLEKKTGKTVEIKTAVDEDLIAGLRVRINDELLDNSVATKLAKMKDAVNKTAI